MTSETKAEHFQRMPWSSAARLIVWFDPNIHQYDPEFHYLTGQVKAVGGNVTLFDHFDERIQYLEVVYEEKITIITSGASGQQFVPQIHLLSQVASIYIFCANPSRHTAWTSAWEKVKGLFDCIELVYEDIQKQRQPFQQEYLSTSFIDTVNNDLCTGDLNRLELTLMRYTQLFKRIILDMNEEERSPKDFLAYCREKYADNQHQLKLIDQFEQDYSPDRASW